MKEPIYIRISVLLTVLFSFVAVGFSQAENAPNLQSVAKITSTGVNLAAEASQTSETAVETSPTTDKLASSLSISADKASDEEMLETVSGTVLQAKLEDTKTTETEQLAVKNSAELLKILGVLPQDLAQKNTNEKNERIDAAVSEQQFQHMLGDHPRVMYRTKENRESLTDPMIIPWIRNAVIVREMLYDVNLLLAAGKVTQACAVLKDITVKYPDTEEAQLAKDTLIKIQQLRDKADAQKLMDIQAEAEGLGQAMVEIVLDPNLVIDSVMEDIRNPQNSIVIINGKLYRVGDEISGTFPKHYVKSVKEDSIVVEVRSSNASKEFNVSVKKSQ